MEKELDKKVKLDNQLIDLTRERLLASNPSVFASKTDIQNQWSKDP